MLTTGHGSCAGPLWWLPPYSVPWPSSSFRARGRTSGDVALAIMFYGGIAAGVVIITQARVGTPANLNTYLFGAITTTTTW